MSRSQGWLIPLLYEHLLANLRRAKVQIESGDLEGKGESIGKASSIVIELLGSLDVAGGGEIAQRLGALYSFYGSEIMRIGRTLDVGSLDKIILMVADLHESWLVVAKEQIGQIPDGKDSLYESRR